MKAVKVCEKRGQRFYKLDTPVTIAPNPNFEWERERASFKKRIKQEYRHFLGEKIEYVCVSDAHTHIERLLFVAMPINEDATEFACLAGLQLDGKHTLMISGGDPKHVHPDEVYLRRLAKANKQEAQV